MAKRKSDEGTVGTPKKQKIENVKTPAKLNTPKSAKKVNKPKSAKINSPGKGKNTPNGVNNNGKMGKGKPDGSAAGTPKKQKVVVGENAKTPAKPNTPKSAKINKAKGPKADSPGKAKNTPNVIKTPNKPGNKAKSPKSEMKNKQTPQKQKSPNAKKMKKFAGTKPEDGNEVAAETDTPAPAKLNKKPKMNKKKKGGPNIMEKTFSPGFKALGKATRKRLRKKLQDAKMAVLNREKLADASDKLAPSKGVMEALREKVKQIEATIDLAIAENQKKRALLKAAASTTDSKVEKMVTSANNTETTNTDEEVEEDESDSAADEVQEQESAIAAS